MVGVGKKMKLTLQISFWGDKKLLKDSFVKAFRNQKRFFSPRYLGLCSISDCAKNPVPTFAL